MDGWSTGAEPLVARPTSCSPATGSSISLRPGKGVWIRPFGRLLYLMPPYIIEPDDLSRLTAALVRAADLD